MELYVIIFVLLFILSIILLLLHRTNHKYADKISILEQALNKKIEDIPALKKTYADAKHAIDEVALQKKKIQEQTQTIKELKKNLTTLKESQMKVSSETILSEEMADNVDNKTVLLENDNEVEKDKELHSLNKEYNEVLDYMQKGHDISEIAKHFDIPQKRVELIAKFYKIRQEQ